MNHYDQKQNHDNDAADHPKFFTDTGEDKIGVFPGEYGCSVFGVHTGQSAGCKRQLALCGLPGNTPAVRVNGRILGSDQTILLIILQKMGPEKRNCRRDGSPPESEPIKTDTQRKEHGQENQKQD